MESSRVSSSRLLNNLKRLLRHDGQAVIAPNGFCVTDKKGPLMEGELQRARAWGNTIGQIVGEETVVV